jgi:hypothetical protein
VLLCGGCGDVILPIEIAEDDGEKGWVPDLKGYYFIDCRLLYIYWTCVRWVFST